MERQGPGIPSGAGKAATMKQLCRQHQLARDIDTSNMTGEDRARFVQQTLVLCKVCKRWPVFYAFEGRGAEDLICLTCWKRGERG
jgi:hypothetical protein